MLGKNHLVHLLTQWYPNRDNADWVLASIYKTHGPCYRKSGAIMLFSSQGAQLGMLSGGCLESDIATNARKVMQTGQNIALVYDGSDEEDLSFHLGIGCGGTVYIMLQPINANNNYLALINVYQALQSRISGYYYLPITVPDSTRSSLKSLDKNTLTAYFKKQTLTNLEEIAAYHHSQLVIPIIPEPHILIVGGGLDAIPLVNMAKQLGWRVSVWDPRPANARKEYFSQVNHIIQGEASVLTHFVTEQHVNAAIIMSHNVAIDAQALKALSKIQLNYVALLGPKHRRDQVLKQIPIQMSALPYVLSGPAGLNLGGTLPESIALSILSECHAVLYNKDALSKSLNR